MPELSGEELPPLPYDHDALEPHLDRQILEWHHDTHHQGYVNGLNSAEETLQSNRMDGDAGDSAAAMRSVSHNGSGHYLHHLFWRCMSPDGGGEPEGALAERIESDFGSYEGWKSEFRAAASWPASGWALLVYDPVTKQLRNLAVEKHNDGALWGAHPVLALDVWEHSYYYQYGPSRGDFVDNFFEVVNWETVAAEFEKTTAHHESE